MSEARSGDGGGLEVGRFPIARLGLGTLVMRDTLGMYGVFPAEWEQPAEFPIHGLISHRFLRRYRWTLDFDAMLMTFVPAAGER